MAALNAWFFILIASIQLWKYNLAQISPMLLSKELVLEDAFLNFTGLARKYGHPAETYQVKTQDGYLLELYRLPGKRKRPILLMHGFQDSSDTWILRGRNSLAITLADDGYDVWLGNTRGNRYSNSHVEFDSRRRKQYWKFSLHELGYYDLPAIIDTVLHETGAKNLTAIGHSQGNTIFYILGSTRPEYNAKIHLLIALAPICHMENALPPIPIYLKIAATLSKLFRNQDSYSFMRYDGFVNKFVRKFCSQRSIGYAICANLFLFSIIGYDPSELEEVFFQVLINHVPAGTSWMNYEHFGQIGTNKRFARYDYGRCGNLIEYNSTIPPLYELNKVTMAVSLYAGRNDPLSDLKDVTLLMDQLPNHVEYRLVPREQQTHGDYVWGKHMSEYLFPHIYDTLYWYNKYA